MREIQQWVKSKPFGVASPEEYAKNKEFFSNWSVCLIRFRNVSSILFLLRELGGEFEYSIEYCYFLNMASGINPNSQPFLGYPNSQPLLLKIISLFSII